MARSVLLEHCSLNDRYLSFQVTQNQSKKTSAMAEVFRIKF